MRKLILYINSTFNGIVTGDPGKDKTAFMVWTTKSFVEAGSACLLQTMKTVDTILLGRKTYEDLSRPEKWPSVKEWSGVSNTILALGEKINNAHKLVVTRHPPPEGLKWGKYKAPKPLTGGNIEDQIATLKNSEGGDIVVFGSPTLARSLTNANLFDEYQIQLRPVVMNVGESLFDGLRKRIDFHLMDAKPLEDGSLFVKYKPVGNAGTIGEEALEKKK